MAIEQFNIMFDTYWGKEVSRRQFSAVKKWVLFENYGVYYLTYADARVEYYLVEKKYAHGIGVLSTMLSAKLTANGSSQMAYDLIYKIKQQLMTVKV